MASRGIPAASGIGLLTVAAGAVLVLLGYTGLDWYGVGQNADSAPAATFDNLRVSIDQFGGAKAATLYFDWLGWALLIAVIVLGFVANVTNPFTPVARILGFVLGLSGAGATYYALLQYAEAQASHGAAHHNPLYNATWGLMLVLLGFVIAALGAVHGPPRRTPPARYPAPWSAGAR